MDESQEIAYDPATLTEKLQQTVLAYMADPPMTSDGYMSWLTILGPRQSGKSTCAELAAYPLAAYNPGWEHVCLADQQRRAEYLHSRIQYTHKRWPEGVRSPTVKTTETRQVTFDTRAGGTMKTWWAGSDFAGIGQSPDSFHGSELGFWNDAATTMNLIYPGLINRRRSRLIHECTPVPISAPSQEWWKDHCYSSKRSGGRWRYAFFPFWDVKNARRTWKKDWKPSNEELRLIEQYGAAGLTWENLAFRREMLDTDSELRKFPELFRVWYPFDDTSCWGVIGGGVVPRAAIDRLGKQDLKEWKGPLQVYRQHDPQAPTLICVDPVGYAARDHAAFHVLQVWDDEIIQAATFSDHVDPEKLVEVFLEVAKMYDNPIVFAESNGVGQAFLALLRMKEYPRIYYSQMPQGQGKGRPGIVASHQSVDKWLAAMSEEGMTRLTLFDKDTFDQLQSYKNDKKIEDSPTSEMLRGGIGKGRRPRHHWDKVSALQLGCFAARLLPVRIRKREDPDRKVLLFKDMTWDQLQEYRKRATKSETKRPRYRATKRRR